MNGATKNEKLYIYLDETYNLQNKTVYSLVALLLQTSEHIKLEYKRLLKSLGLLSKKANKEVKSTDKDALKDKKKHLSFFKNLSHIDLIGISNLESL